MKRLFLIVFLLPLLVHAQLSPRPGANASSNVTQFGGNAVVTGTGVSGNGVPRVTVSSDSFPANPSGLVTGQIVIAVTGTAVCLPSNALTNGVIVKSLLSNNAAKQTVGGASVTNTVNGTGNGYILQPGEASSFGVTNSSAVCGNGTAGDIFTYSGN